MGKIFLGFSWYSGIYEISLNPPDILDFLPINDKIVSTYFKGGLYESQKYFIYGDPDSGVGSVNVSAVLFHASGR